MSAKWEATYAAKSETERSWTQPVPAESLAFITDAGAPLDGPIIDIGGGASRLVDELLARQHTDITVLDISAAALAEARRRISETVAEANVHWIVADLTEWTPQRGYAVWHDRAVFHFLVEPDDQEAYVAAASEGVVEGGSLILATFAPAGPEQCSGLPVRRWSADQLAARFAEHFELVKSAVISHTTPWGSTQPFTWVLLRRRGTSVGRATT